jgi:hypothetical protein
VKSQLKDVDIPIYSNYPNDIYMIKLEKNRQIRERNLLYPEKMFTEFRMILEEATNQKWQLTQKN